MVSGKQGSGRAGVRLLAYALPQTLLCLHRCMACLDPGAKRSLLMIPGLILGGYVAYHYFFTGVNHYVKGVVAIALTIVGFNSLLLGIIALYLKRMEIRLRRQLKRLGSILRVSV